VVAGASTELRADPTDWTWARGHGEKNWRWNKGKGKKRGWMRVNPVCRCGAPQFAGGRGSMILLDMALLLSSLSWVVFFVLLLNKG
jgi:hypothetical protein